MTTTTSPRTRRTIQVRNMRPGDTVATTGAKIESVTDLGETVQITYVGSGRVAGFRPTQRFAVWTR